MLRTKVPSNQSKPAIQSCAKAEYSGTLSFQNDLMTKGRVTGSVRLQNLSVKGKNSDAENRILK